MAGVWSFLSDFYNRFVLVYFFAVDFIYISLLLLALREIVLYLRRNQFVDYAKIMQSEFAIPISILAPAYNEEKTITDSVQSLMMLNYGKYEAIVINDGSKDSTLQKLIDAFKLRKITPVYESLIPTEEVYSVYRSPMPAYKRLVVLDKKNGGKADALNAGINVARYPLVCCIDADSLLEQDALLKVVKPFLENGDQMIAAGGIVRIVNGCKVERGHVTEIRLLRKWIPTFQVVEYLRAFLSVEWAGPASTGCSLFQAPSVYLNGKR